MTDVNEPSLSSSSSSSSLLPPLPTTFSYFWSATGLTHIQHHLDFVGEKVLTLANPAQSSPRVTADWAFVHLSDACLLLAAYCVLVFVCAPLMKMLTGEEKEKGASNPRGGRGNKTLMGKFAAEPILLLQTIYNLAQVGLCYYMIKAAFEEYRREGYSFVCNRFDPTRDGMARVLWVFYFSKIVDFLDTVFIVIRQKWRQLSFLHVYHHLSIFLFYWLSINAAYDGDIYFTIILNSFVHLVMYFYYFLRTVDVHVPTPIKQTITNLQMIQFLMMNVQAILVLVKGCPFPPRVTAGYLVYIISLLVLFLKFSQSEYGSKKASKTVKKQ
eukprot:GHVS01041224.1.p1 GENE.GHVS01041224.1~~GHVS01041224.1.p1  ORF type:complete len:327 (+),score=58.10 GHVS01041224.1:126-1106(+)